LTEGTAEALGLLVCSAVGEKKLHPAIAHNVTTIKERKVRTFFLFMASFNGVIF
jgi:hypothetical protein